MRKPRYTRQLKRDLKRAGKRGKKLEKLDDVMRALIREKPLAFRLKDHSLKGDYAGYRECHIEPNWLLIYKLEPGAVIFERTGTHADLFE